MARKPPGPKAAALGAELRTIRKRGALSMAEVAERLGWSESLVSRLENGKRNIDSEEVSALLAIYSVTGTDRERLMALARSSGEDSWLDPGLPGLPSDSVKMTTYEANAAVIVDWAPLLVPGLLQTMEYTRAFMLSDGLSEADIGSRLMARQRRQQILDRAQYTAYLDEGVLRRQIGGPRVMRRQIQRLIEIAEESRATIRVTPGDTDGHSGLVSPFLLLMFEHEAPRVHVELARSAVFFTGEEATEIYISTTNQLDALSLDVAQSLAVLRTAAVAMGSET